MRVYADNGATTKMCRRAIDAMLPFMEEDFGNPSSIYSMGRRAAFALDDCRERIGKIFGCSGREIIFTSGGSEGNNQAVLTGAAHGAKDNKKHIIASPFEHPSILNILKHMEKQGFEVTFLPVEENGIINPDRVEELIRPDTCLVTIMYANNEIGTIQPIGEIGEICRERGVILHTDAVAAAGHIEINVERDNIHLMTISAHKFSGPKGVGALYVKGNVKPAKLIHGGNQERGRRGGTENVPGIAGMAAALEHSTETMAATGEKLKTMSRRLISQLLEIPGAVLNGDMDLRLPGNVNFSFEDVEGEQLLRLLDEKGVMASSGSACSAGSLEASHVLQSIGRTYLQSIGSLRLTLGGDNTDEEVEYIIKAVKDSIDYLKNR